MVVTGWLQAHDLEHGRKESEQLSRELHCHMDSFGKQFDKIREKISIPPAQEKTATTTSTTCEQQQQDKKCHDETLQKELSDIRAQIEDAKRK